MKTKVSKTLETLLGQTTFDLLKANIRHSYKDYLALELLHNDTSLAYTILSLMLTPQEIDWITAHIFSLIEHNPISEELAIDEYLLSYRKSLGDEYASYGKLSTIHLLLDICSDKESATAQTLARYDICEITIKEKLDEIIHRVI